MFRHCPGWLGTAVVGKCETLEGQTQDKNESKEPSVIFYLSQFTLIHTFSLSECNKIGTHPTI